MFGSASDCENIDIVDAKDWLSEKNMDRIALIKLNIEGGEYELLEHLIEIDFIRHIEHIQVHFHDVAKDSRSRMEQIQNELRKTHYPTYQYEFVWENWTRLNQNSQ